ncbi:MAG: phosphonate C-P lyase system protein PhnH [Deltaproteobacteria bacterium]|jgi:alpha-D-ribose 1-methylphosphonate 5-triphosphate synthase subunit PhnH|nr:phosphonate C-P lyase system protein PhnH [Deltaproteobacteria bacterium]
MSEPAKSRLVASAPDLDGPAPSAASGARPGPEFGLEFGLELGLEPGSAPRPERTSGPASTVSAGAPRPGFVDEPLAAARTFRLALAALAEPAQALAADWAGFFQAPPPLPVVAAALALTLLDGRASTWLSPAWAGARPWLAFHRGPVFVDEPAQADFVWAASLAELPPLGSLRRGSHLRPHVSATAVIGSLLASRDADPLLASGPGLAGPRLFAGHGLSREFVAAWRDNQAAFPLGVDVFLTGPGLLAGLPRTTRLSWAA